MSQKVSQQTPLQQAAAVSLQQLKVPVASLKQQWPFSQQIAGMPNSPQSLVGLEHLLHA